MMAGPGRFWTRAGLIVLANFLLIGMVLAIITRPGLRPRLMIPGDGRVGVSTRPTIKVEYRRPMDETSLREAFRVEPPIEGTVEVDDTTLTFRPARALMSGVSYTVTLGAGVRAVSGDTAQEEVRATFLTRSARLIVIRRDGANWSLWAVDPSQGASRQIASSWEVGEGDTSPPIVAPAWSGDEIAYVKRLPGSTWSLWIADVDSDRQRSIAQDQTGVVGGMSWSPRGDLLAYEHIGVFGTTITSPKIWAITSDGAQTALLYGRGEESGSKPVWAPDGRQLGFYENKYRAIGIFAFGSMLRSVNTSLSQAVSWAPDGRTFAYIDRSGEGSPRSNIRIARLLEAGSESQSLPDEDAVVQSPAWSPDGHWIAFTRLGKDGGGIWVSRPDGSERYPLTTGTGWIYGSLSWSPDGTAVAFGRVPLRAGSQDQAPELWIAPLDDRPYPITPGGWLVGWVP